MRRGATLAVVACAFLAAAVGVALSLRRHARDGEPARRLQEKLKGFLANPEEGVRDMSWLEEFAGEEEPEGLPVPSVAGTRFPEQRLVGYATTYAEWDAAFSNPNATNRGASDLRDAAAAIRTRLDEARDRSRPDPMDLDAPAAIRAPEWRQELGALLAPLDEGFAALDAALTAPALVFRGRGGGVTPVRDPAPGGVAAMGAQRFLRARFWALPPRDDRMLALTSLARLATRLECRDTMDVDIVLACRRRLAVCVRELIESGEAVGGLTQEIDTALEPPPALLRRALLASIVESCVLSDWQLAPEGQAFAGRVPDSQVTFHATANRDVTRRAANDLDFAVAEDRIPGRLDLAAAYARAVAAEKEYKGNSLYVGVRAYLVRRFAESLAAGRLARASIALQRRRAKDGAWPASLDAIAGDVPADTLIDPFTNQRLLLTASPGGVRLESRAAFPGSSPPSDEERREDGFVWDLTR
jgi:hypothetical protein